MDQLNWRLLLVTLLLIIGVYLVLAYADSLIVAIDNYDYAIKQHRYRVYRYYGWALIAISAGLGAWWLYTGQLWVQTRTARMPAFAPKQCRPCADDYNPYKYSGYWNQAKKQREWSDRLLGSEIASCNQCKQWCDDSRKLSGHTRGHENFCKSIDRNRLSISHLLTDLEKQKQSKLAAIQKFQRHETIERGEFPDLPPVPTHEPLYHE